MASWTNPVIHGTGDTFAVSDYNVLANNETFLYQAPYASYYNSVATSVPTATNTQLTLSGTEYSGYGFSVSSNNAVVPLAGTYMALFSGGTAAASGTGFSFIEQNGTVKNIGAVVTGSANGTVSPGGKAVKCAANDAFGLYVVQSSGGTVNSLNASTESFLSMAFIGST